METFQPHKKSLRLLYFWIGIVATFAYRIIIVLTQFNAVWLKISWYIGTIGFILYFAHRFEISTKREKLISQYQLAKKIDELPNLTQEEKGAMGYIMKTLVSTREKWNYIFIFITSGLALLWGILTDFILK